MQHIRDAIPNQWKAGAIDPDAAYFRDRIPELETWGITDDQILSQRALLIEYLQQKRVCEHCTGFERCGKEGDLKGFSQVLHPYGNQVSLGVERCEPYVEWSIGQRMKKWSLQYGGVASDGKFTFRNFPHEQRVNHPRLLNYAERFANTYTPGQEMSGVYLFGPPGVGKTHLMLAVLNRLTERGVPCLFMRCDSIFDRMRQIVAAGEDLESFLDTCSNAPVLGIDEFGQERANEFTMEKLFRIINHRFHNNLPTWFTSNYLPNELYQTKDGNDILAAVAPLRSRVMQMGKMAKLNGEDARLRNVEHLS